VSKPFLIGELVSPFPVCSISSGDAAHYPETSLTFATEGETT
jgi:hypothetical protein